MSQQKLSYEELEARLKKAEADLAAAQLDERLRTTFDAVSDAICLLDGDLKVIRCNRAATQIFNKGRKEIIGKSCFEVVHGSTKPRPDSPVARMKKSLKRERSEIQIDDRWFEVTVDPILDQTGNLTGAVHIVTDVSDRRRIELAARESRRQLATLMDNLPGMAYRCLNDEDWTMEFVSGGCLPMTGYTPEQLIGNKDAAFGELIFPEDRQRVWDEVQRAVRDQNHFQLVYRIRARCGQMFHVWEQGVAIRDDNGEVVAVEGFIIDITSQHEAESLLNRLGRILDRSANGIYVFGSDSHFLTQVNQGAKQNLGFSDGELMKMTPFDLLAGKDSEELKSALTALSDGAKESVTLETEFRRKNGSSYPVELRLHFAANETPAVFVAIALDISERRAAEASREKLRNQLIQAQKLESVGHLAGGVAHDFNNILSVILLNGEITLDRLPSADPLRDPIQQIVDAAERSAGLTRQLLAFSRKQTLQPEVLDLNEVIQNLKTMLGRLIGENIDLVMKLQPTVGSILADPGQIEQVVLNLAINARDAMPTGGRLTLETSPASFSEGEGPAELAAGDYVRLLVSDTGSGMDADVLSMIFEPFFTTKEMGKGTGLGLSTVYGIIKQSGGEIDVASDPGTGTLFSIYLPITQESARSKSTEGLGEKPANGSEQILVVEDESSLRNLFHELLPSLGYQATVAANGAEALQILQEQQLAPDLIISDVVMPNMSGKELVERVRKMHPGLKVLYMSGYTDDIIEAHGVVGPDQSFIQKPFKIGDIAAKVRAILGHASPQE